MTTFLQSLWPAKPESRRCFPLAAWVVFAMVLAGCSTLHRGGAQSPSATADDSASAAQPDDSTPPAPGASIDIAYAQKDDYLASLSVTEYSAADEIEPPGAGQNISVVRFDGGITVWSFQADRGILSLESRAKFAIGNVKYAQLPAHFTQTVPDSGPPAPLEAGRYYIVTATRASGAASYEAIKVEPDGSIDGYGAQPRAGTSYALCCNVSPEFIAADTSAVPEPAGSIPDNGAGPVENAMPDTGGAAPGGDAIPDQGPPPDQGGALPDDSGASPDDGSPAGP